MQKSFLYRVILMPTAVFLSVLFGASYGSGREVMEFVSSNGPSGGLVALLVLITTHVVVLGLSFELTRLYKVYDYVSFFKVLLKKGWFAYEIVIIVGLVIALSITATVGGTIVGDKFDFDARLGTAAIFILVVLLTYFGREIVAKSMMLSVVALFVVLAVLIWQIFQSETAAIAAAFREHPHEWSGLSTGLMYAIGGGGYLPLLLYCAMGLRTRAEVVTSALAAATIAAIPALIFHLAFMANFPAIVEEEIPAYWMLENLSSPMMLNFYVLVMFVLVAQTGVGVLQGLIERVDNWYQARRGQPMPALGHSGLAGGVFLVCTAFGTMGITALILRGYTVMFGGFIVVFIIPLITHGAYLVYSKVDSKQEQN